MRKLAIVLLIILAVLAATNPGRDKFQEFVKREGIRLIEEKSGGDDPVAEVLMPFFAPWIARTFQRDNYLIFSVYRFGDFKVLGIAGQFIPLNRLDEKDLESIMADMEKDLSEVPAEEMEKLMERLSNDLLKEWETEVPQLINTLQKMADTVDVERLQKELEKDLEQLEKAGEAFFEELQRLQESQSQ